jgi:hypothetical protein
MSKNQSALDIPSKHQSGLFQNCFVFIRNPSQQHLDISSGNNRLCETNIFFTGHFQSFVDYSNWKSLYCAISSGQTPAYTLSPWIKGEQLTLKDMEITELSVWTA